MSILQDKTDKATGRYLKDSVSTLKADAKKDRKSNYAPTDEQRECITSFLRDFQDGWQTMHLPRPELNDLSLYQRHIVDMLAFNTYQENDGQPMMEDRLGGWRSQAMRPVQRNKAISMAAHRTARQLVPKVSAFNDQSEEQQDDAKAMSYLVDWARERANYPFMALHRDIMAIYSPISWGYSEYVEAYRNVKDKKVDGKWTYRRIVDEEESGFRHVPVSTDQVFFPNFYERDPQKQDFIIYRRVISYDQAKAKYGDMPDFQFVEPGIQVIMDDPNTGFYQVYDSHMRGRDVEEVIRWRKSTDSREVMVNGILLSEPYAPNPRDDHQYPWDCYYYLPINEKCIAGKSLIFALGPEAALLNTQYQMMNDGNMLNLFPPTVTAGSEKTGMDVIVPGLNLAFAEKDVTLTPLRTADSQGLMTTIKVMEQVENSINESSQDPFQQGQNTGAPSTAYEISRIEQNAATVLGLSMKFQANSHVIPYGKLLLSDILQYMTVAQAEKITDDGGLVYRTFLSNDPAQPGRKNKVSFDATLPETMTKEEKDDMSFRLLMDQSGNSVKKAANPDTTLHKANPILFRQHKYVFTIDDDVLNPRSSELMRAFDIETYDRAIISPVADQEKIFTDLLMATNPKTSRAPKDYVMKPQPMNPALQQPGQQGIQQNGQQPPPQQGTAAPSPMSSGVSNQPQGMRT